MYSTGWKVTENLTAIDGTIGQIAEWSPDFSVPLDRVISVENAQWLLVSLITSTTNDDSTILSIYGSHTNEVSQSKDGVISTLMCSIRSANGSCFTNCAFKNHGEEPNWTQLDASTMAYGDSGADDEDGAAIPSQHFYTRLQGNQTVPGYMKSPGSDNGSFDVFDANKLWFHPGTGTMAGPSWAAIPCGAFSYMQLVVATLPADPVANKFSAVYNLLF